jgi:hypothetical protein
MSRHVGTRAERTTPEEKARSVAYSRVRSFHKRVCPRLDWVSVDPGGSRGSGRALEGASGSGFPGPQGCSPRAPSPESSGPRLPSAPPSASIVVTSSDATRKISFDDPAKSRSTMDRGGWHHAANRGTIRNPPATAQRVPVGPRAERRAPLRATLCVRRFGVQSVNGVDNRRVELQQVKPADPQFYVLLQNLGRIQASGDIGVRIQRVDKEETLDLVLRPKLPAVVEDAVRNVSGMRGLDPAAREFRVVYGAVATNDKEIAILSRSILKVGRGSLVAHHRAREAHDGTPGEAYGGAR